MFSWPSQIPYLIATEGAYLTWIITKPFMQAIVQHAWPEAISYALQVDFADVLASSACQYHLMSLKWYGPQHGMLQQLVVTQNRVREISHAG